MTATRASWGTVRYNLVPYVGATCERVQKLYTAEVPSAIAALARLRGGVRRPPGDMPEMLEYTEVDERLFGPQHGEAPTQVEWAVHLALTMFAMHQQSQRDTPMHRPGPGYGFGAVVAKLADASANETAVRRRFTAASTAIDITELAEHMYGLIRQLRQYALPMDYGQLAADLFAWQTPDAAVGVRRVWGRDLQATLHRLRTKDDQSTDSEDAS